MRRVSYAGGSFVTADDVAAAVLAYAEELANRHRAASLEVPALDLPGGEHTVGLLVGPSSQLLSEPIADARALDTAVFIADIEQRMHALTSPAADWDGTMPWEF